jgi:hypothetical protein
MKNRTFLTLTILPILFSATASAQAVDPDCLRCGSATIVTNEKLKKTIVDSLTRAFTRSIGGQVVDCSEILVEDFGKGFSAFGGVCDATVTGKKNQWMICSDKGVGNFSAVTGARWEMDPRKFLTQFIESNCVGG